jgi:integrating conjugative element membrane protein (TIGR03745 family)
MAALPQSQPPTRGEGSNLMQTMQNYAFDGFSLLGLIICAVIFSGVAWHAFGTYHEIQHGKKKWMDLGATAAVGVAILGVAIFLVTKATNIL